MATVAELERTIDAMLDHPRGVKQYQLARTVQGKVYEAYVFTLCLRAVRENLHKRYDTGEQQPLEFVCLNVRQQIPRRIG